MEINKLLLLIVFIIFILIIYKCIKIYNIKILEKYNDSILSPDDVSGHKSDSLEDILKTTKCEYNSNIQYIDNKCKKVYNPINNDTMITSCDVYENEISLHNCNENDVSIYSHINMNNEETKYDIKRNMKLIHYKRTDADLDRQIQSLELVKKINLDDSDFLFNEKQEIDKIINDNNDNDNFLGILIKDETPNKEFYKIIIDNDSEIEIIEETSNNNILYIKKNIDCRGRWEKCKYDDNKKISSRKYIHKISKIGNGVECLHKNDTTETCAEWSSVCGDEEVDGIIQNVKEWIRYDMCNENNDCNNDSENHKNFIQDDCTQNKDCNVTFNIDNCYENSDNIIVNKPTIIKATGKGRCAYEEGKEYHSLREIDQYDRINEMECNNGENLEQCVCNDRELYSLPCSYNTRFFWGAEDGSPRKDTQPGNCMLEVYNYNPPTSKSGLEECPLKIKNPNVNVKDASESDIIDVGNSILEKPFTNLNDEMGNYSRKFFKVDLDKDKYRFCQGMQPQECKGSIKYLDCNSDQITLIRGMKWIQESPAKYNGTCTNDNNLFLKHNRIILPKACIPKPKPKPKQVNIFNSALNTATSFVSNVFSGF